MSDLQSPAASTGSDAAGKATSESPTTATAAANAPSAPAGAAGGRSFLPQSTLLRHLVLLLLGAVLAVLILEITDPFTNSQLAALSYYAIAAGGLTVLTGLNGQISLGHGALMAVGAYTTALLLAEPADALPLPLILLISVVTATAVGAVVGVAAARLHGPYLAGATLALAVGLPGLAIYFNEWLGGDQGLRVRAPRAPEWFESFIAAVSGNPATNTKWLAYVGAICLLVTFFLLANLVRSRIGRTWRAVRDQEVAAELAGINLGAWRVLAFVVRVGLPGLAIYFHGTLGGEQGLRVRAPQPPDSFDSFIGFVSGANATSTKWLAYVGTICLLITYFLLANLVRSRIGRTWRAVRDQEVAAELAGINLGAWRVLAFVVSAAAAGLAGGVLALVVRLAAPSGFTLVLSLALLTAIVIGGLGSLIGALLGSALLVFLPPFVTDLGVDLGLNNTEAAQLAPFVYGVVLIVAMIFAPAGFVGTLRLRWMTQKAKRASRAAAGTGRG